MSKSKKKKLESMVLPLRMYGGEQDGSTVTIPQGDFVVTGDADFLKTVGEDERDDKFIYAYTESGISKNNRNWSPDVMRSIGDQTVAKMPPGYLGHIKPTDYGFEFPEPQIVWFGSYVESLPAPSTDIRLWLKGYLLPTATDLETWIKTKAVDSISVYGTLTYTVDDAGVTQIESVDLKSIDISRKLAEGLTSSIVGLSGEMSKGGSDIAGEMDVATSDVSDIVAQAVKDMLRPQYPATLNPDGSYNTPYIYVWVRTMYLNTNKAIVSCDLPNGNNNVYYEVSFSYDSDGNVTVGDTLTEVRQVTSYVPTGDSGTSKESEDVGEMNLEELKFKNPELYKSLKTEVAGEMSDEKNVKVMIEKAGEMDAVASIIGSTGTDKISAVVKGIIEKNKKFAGEMSKLFCGEQDEAGEADADAIVEAANKVVTDKAELDKTVQAITDVVKPEKDQNLVDAVTNVIELQQVATAKSAIEAVNTVMDDLMKDEEDDVVKEYVRDDFANILNAKPTDIKDADWQEKAEKAIKDGYEASVKKHKERLAKITNTSKAAGEMSAVMSIVGSRNATVSTTGSDIDPDIAEAAKLGYVNKSK